MIVVLHCSIGLLSHIGGTAIVILLLNYTMHVSLAILPEVKIPVDWCLGRSMCVRACVRVCVC